MSFLLQLLLHEIWYLLRLLDKVHLFAGRTSSICAFMHNHVEQAPPKSWVRFYIALQIVDGFALCDRYPFGTLVDFVCDGSGFPVIRLSSLAVPTRNVLENPQCSIVVQMPGWSGLTNARVTIFGDVYQLPAEMEPVAKQVHCRLCLPVIPCSYS